jgi:hypothetical protein
VSLRSEFHVVMSVTISALKRCSVRLYLQLFIGGLMPYLCCLFLFEYIGAQHTFLLVLFAFLRLVYSMLPFSKNCLFLIAPSVFSNIYL